MLGFFKRLLGYEETHPADLVIESKRSPEWQRVRNRWVSQHPKCEVCGSPKVEVHHIFPVHAFPDKELEPTNFISLCRPHHETFGHLGDWKSANFNVVGDATHWRARYRDRPTL